MTMANKIQRYEFIECIIPANSTQTRFYFPDQPNLRFTNLLNLVSYTQSNIQTSILSNSDIISSSDALNDYLVLYFDDKEAVNRIPLSELTSATDLTGLTFGSIPALKNMFAGQQVTWAKSYIILPTALAPANNTSVPFGVYYA